MIRAQLDVSDRTFEKCDDFRNLDAIGGILFAKVERCTPRIFRENKRRETIADSYTLNRVAEIAGEFDARGPVPHIFTPKSAYSPQNF